MGKPVRREASSRRMLLSGRSAFFGETVFLAVATQSTGAAGLTGNLEEGCVEVTGRTGFLIPARPALLLFGFDGVHGLLSVGDGSGILAISFRSVQMPQYSLSTLSRE